MTQARAVAAFLSALALVVVAINVAIPRVRIYGNDPPDYGTWMGVLEVERKMRLLRDFASEGEVDALILSSSMGDLGISAETLTRDLSAARGRSFRVFNFSMGGADISSYPLLYRYARVIAKPKEIWVASPLSLSLPTLEKGSLDAQLLRGPLGRHWDDPWMIRASFELHELPMVRYAAAIRDAAVHAKFAGRPISNLDLYEINAYGDTVSWLYNVTQYESAPTVRQNRRKNNMKFLEQPSESELRKLHDRYFNPRTMEALADLKELAARDAARIRIVAIDLAIALTMRDRQYFESSRHFFDSLSRYLGADVVDVRASFEVRPYMISDLVHLNTLGSTEFSRLLAARMSGRRDPAPAGYVASEKIMDSVPDPKWRPFTAMLTRRHDDPSATLELQFIQNWGVRLIPPGSRVDIALRLPDDSEAVVPGRALHHGLVLADTSGLRFEPRDQIVTAQIVPRREAMGAGLDLPVIAHRWLAQAEPPGFYEARSSVKVERASYGSVEPVRVSWSALERPSSKDWIGLFPVGVPGAGKVVWAHTNGASSGSLELTPTLKAGKFEARLFPLNGLGSIPGEEAVDIVAARGDVSAMPPAVGAGGTIEAAWSGVNYPRPNDFVGLFEKGSEGRPLTFANTGGKAQGALPLPIAAGLSPGEYEVRLYSSGGWVRLASAPVTVLPARAGVSR
jgi:hypothetical protein